jgi:hypothetical protein
VQAVAAPVPRDGGAAVGSPPPTTTRRSSGVTQVQVGCLEHCYGATTLDTSGLTLAQIEQLLGELHVPAPPTATAAPGGEQHATQQTAVQSETGDGHQSESASQHNGTIQVVVTPAGAPADAGTPTGPEAVNQTAQGIVQLQVGCIFYCSGTRQAQEARQSNATVQSVDGPGAGTVNTVSRVIWQVQVGCVVWCDDAVETQTAAGTDSTIVTVAAPADAVPTDVTPPQQARRPPVVHATQAARAASQAVRIERPHRASRRARHVGPRHGAPRPVRSSRRTIDGSRPSALAPTSAAPHDWVLTVALVLAALGFGVWRWREVR